MANDSIIRAYNVKWKEFVVDAREDARHALRREIPDLSTKEWDELSRQRYPERVLNGEIPLDDVVEHVRRYRVVFGRQREASPPTRDRDVIDVVDSRRGNAPEESVNRHERQVALIDERQRVLSRVVARMTGADPDVQAFRRRNDLDGDLFPLSDVVAWVKAQQRKSPGEGRKLLYYVARWGSDQELGTGIATVAADSELDRLRRLSERLARENRWTEAASTSFVLADITPRVQTSEVTIGLHPSPLALSRITLTVDPTLPPSIVAEEYKQVRDAVLGARYRSLTEKHLALADFADEFCGAVAWDDYFAEIRHDADGPQREQWHSLLVGDYVIRSDTGPSWERCREHWNETYPHWAYAYTSHFRRDAKHALQRLLDAVDVESVATASTDFAIRYVTQRKDVIDG
jgi:hypothetical protein